MSYKSYFFPSDSGKRKQSTEEVCLAAAAKLTAIKQEKPTSFKNNLPVSPNTLVVQISEGVPLSHSGNISLSSNDSRYQIPLDRRPTPSISIHLPPAPPPSPGDALMDTEQPTPVPKPPPPPPPPRPLPPISHKQSHPVPVQELPKTSSDIPETEEAPRMNTRQQPIGASNNPIQVFIPQQHPSPMTNLTVTHPAHPMSHAMAPSPLPPSLPYPTHHPIVYPTTGYPNPYSIVPVQPTVMMPPTPMPQQPQQQQTTQVQNTQNTV